MRAIGGLRRMESPLASQSLVGVDTRRHARHCKPELSPAAPDLAGFPNDEIPVPACRFPCSRMQVSLFAANREFVPKLLILGEENRAPAIKTGNFGRISLLV